jgi:chromosomal replication initiation ATPase DnaA
VEITAYLIHRNGDPPERHEVSIKLTSKTLDEIRQSIATFHKVEPENVYFQLRSKLITEPQHLDKIIAAVCDVCQISHDEIIGNRRFRKLSDARLMYFHFATKYTNCRDKEIGKAVNRDRTTVIVQRAKANILRNQILDFDEKFIEIEELIINSY